MDQWSRIYCYVAHIVVHLVNVEINNGNIIYRLPSLSAVSWFQKNRALSETALTELHRKVSVQKLQSAT
jgi:hypothetical protein